MKTILISGFSGAGKTTALAALEDAGCFCTANLPPALLPQLAACHAARDGGTPLAVSTDIRSREDAAATLEQLNLLRQQGLHTRLLFLEADDNVLLRRIAETRRRHPFAAEGENPAAALQRERAALAPLRGRACRIDTTRTDARRLRRLVGQWFAPDSGTPVLVFQSFGFKHGTPADADFLFDVRSLPNPYYDPVLRPYNGTQPPIRNYLDAQPQAAEMTADIAAFLQSRLPHIREQGRDSLNIAVGCTGGQHRSVYTVERLAAHFAPAYPVLVRHRELDAQNPSDGPRG